MQVLLAHGIDKFCHQRQTVLNRINWRSKLVVNRSEHNVRVFLHYEFPLKFFFGVGICEDKNDFLLASRFLDFNSNVKEFGDFDFIMDETFAALIQLIEGGFFVESYVFFIHSLLDHEGLILGDLGNSLHETLLSHVDKATVSACENSHELLHRRNFAPVGVVETVQLCVRVIRHLDLKDLDGFLIHVDDFLAVVYDNSVWQVIQNVGQLVFALKI